MQNGWYGNGYATTQTTFYVTIPVYSSNSDGPPPHRSKRERRLQELLAKFDGDTQKLGFRLQVAELERKAKSDAASRAQKPHPASCAPTARRLQTYDAALAARMASRRP